MNNKLAADLSPAALRTLAEARIRTCQMYLDQRSLVGQNTVVVSSLANGRGVQIGKTTSEGQQTFISMFPRGMPTLFSPKDAATLVAELNEHLASLGNPETLSAMNHIDWWTEELAAAERTLDFIDLHLASN